MEYAPVYAKVRCWKKNILKASSVEDFSRLDLTQTTEEIRKRMSKVTFNSETSVRDIEGLLRQETYNYIQSGLHYLSGGGRRFVQEWCRYYEIENVKYIVRCVFNQKKVDYLYDLSRKSKIRLELVKDIRSLDELQDFLSGTDYYRLAADSFPRVKEEGKTFFFEMNLDNYFAQSLKKKVASLPPMERKSVKDIVAYYLEMNRIMWIYRARYNFGMTASETMSIVPRVFEFLREKQYEELMHAESIQGFIAILKQVGFIDDEKTAEANLERELHRKVLLKAHRGFTGIPFKLGALLAFSVYHMVHARNMVTILEGRRLGVSFDDVKQLLVLA
jgi:vacuolar-type H+-ATPase subunit C/Vma6